MLTVTVPIPIYSILYTAKDLFLSIGFMIDLVIFGYKQARLPKEGRVLLKRRIPG